MLQKTTNIRVLQDDHFLQRFTIKLPKSMYKKLTSPTELSLTFGKQSVIVKIEIGSTMIELSESVALALAFPNEELTSRVHYERESNTLILGPVFAVLARETTNTALPFGLLTPFFTELARYCSRKNIFFYVFSLEDHGSDQIRGYRYINRVWKKSQLPLPHVIYNRLPARHSERTELAKQFFKRCAEKAIPYFNERFLNKWEVYKTLFTHPEIAPHLPESVLYQQTADLDVMLQKHLSLYLKPIHGSLGRRIVRIEHDGNEYTIDYSTFADDHLEKTQSLLALLKTVLPLIKKQSYIIQQGIHTITYNERPIDFRILCHKANDGNWKVTSIVARVSAEKHFVANLAMGGSLYRLEEVLLHAFRGKEVTHFKRLLMELAIHCATIVDEQAIGVYGEFGVDLALDQDGKPWLLEINTKPSKTEDHTYISPAIRPSTKAIVHFAAFLSGYELHEEDS